jgi:coenzyme F420-reducing hydrogenase gamma subunit
MSVNGRPRVAFFDFTGCEGCQLTVVDALQTYPELLGAIELVAFREAMTEASDEYDIAFVEGSCARESDVKRLQDIRERARFVVALGACAHLGGINAIRNRLDLRETQQSVYGEYAHWFEVGDAKAIGDVIAVDAVIPGCPIDRHEFIAVVKGLLQGRLIQPPNYPVCIECRLHENICVYHKGSVCLGPITRAGCQAICPAYGFGCEGCRGPISEAQLDALQEVLAEHGLDARAAEAALTIFMTNQLPALQAEEESYAR